MQYHSSSILDRSQYQNYTEQSSSANIQDSIRSNLSNEMAKDIGAIQGQTDNIVRERDAREIKKRDIKKEL